MHAWTPLHFFFVFVLPLLLYLFSCFVLFQCGLCAFYFLFYIIRYKNSFLANILPIYFIHISKWNCAYLWTKHSICNIALQNFFIIALLFICVLFLFFWFDLCAFFVFFVLNYLFNYLNSSNIVWIVSLQKYLNILDFILTLHLAWTEHLSTSIRVPMQRSGGWRLVWTAWWIERLSYNRR